MSKIKNYLTIAVIAILAFFAGNLTFPQVLNLPHFPNIPFKMGLDLQGGVHLVYQADLTKVEPVNHERDMDALRDRVEGRVDRFGVSEPLVQVKGERLIVELAGIFDVAEAVKIIGETHFLRFKEERTKEERDKIFSKQEEVKEKLNREEITELTPEELQKIQEIEDWQYTLKHPFFKVTKLTGKYLERSRVEFAHPVPEPIIALQFNKEGAKLFEEITARNINQRIAIYIDQKQISAPVVQEKISGGNAQISGDFTIEEAKELSRKLNDGALPVPIELISQQTVGPILGKISLEKSLVAGLFGFLAVVIFLVFVYRLPGLLTILALGIYILLLLSLFKIISVTLTLAGIAGIIFSIGLAVDANVLIFSRMGEELKDGRSIKAAIEEGFKRAWPSIRDGNLTTLVVACILFAFGTGFVKGFALTLFLGILISVFSAFVITKTFLVFFERTKLEKVKWLWK